MSKTVIVPTGGLGMGMGCAPGYGGYGWGGGIGEGLMIGALMSGRLGGWGNNGWGGGMMPGFGGWGFGNGCNAEGRIEGNIERQMGMLSDNINCRFNDVNSDVRTNRVEGSIGGVKDQIGHIGDRMFTTALSDKDSYYGLQKAICDTDKDVVLASKDIIASQLKCCCEQKEIAIDQGARTREAIHQEGCATRALIERLEDQRLRTQLVDEKVKVNTIEARLDNARQTGEIAELVRKNREECFSAINVISSQIGNLANSVAASNKDVINNFGTLSATLQNLSNSMTTGTTS